MSGNIWVYLETKNHQLENVGLELLGVAQELAKTLGVETVGILIGEASEPLAQEALSFGADSIIIVQGQDYHPYTTDTYTHALVTLSQKYQPIAILIGATPDGRDLAPRVSARLQTGLSADCTGLDVDPATGAIIWTRPTLGGHLMANITCRTMPQMGTVRPNVFKKLIPNPSTFGSILVEAITPPQSRTKVLETISHTNLAMTKLEDAQVIVAGGLGMANKASFALLEELATLLGGAVGATRTVVEAGWASPQLQIGQSGKTVNPKLYIACGISGAIQHTIGMSGADVVIAINRDPHAPIFDHADYAIVGNALQIIPELIDQLKKRH